MKDDSPLPSREVLVNYVDKISRIQSTIQDLQGELGQLRRDAQSDGLNKEAVNQLGLIVAKSSHDGGTGLLSDIIRYADQFGVELDTTVTGDQSQPQNTSATKTEPQQHVSRFEPSKVFVSERLTLAFQFALGIAVTSAFIVFLH